MPTLPFFAVEFGRAVCGDVTIAVGISEPYNLCLDDSRHAYVDRFAGAGYCVYVKHPAPTLAFGFNKLVAVMNTFGAFPELKHVLYLDADALIVNMDISILDIAKRYAAADIVFASEEFVNRERRRRCFQKRLGFLKARLPSTLSKAAQCCSRTVRAQRGLPKSRFARAGSALDFAHLSDRAAWIKTAIRNPDIFRKHVIIVDPWGPGR